MSTILTRAPITYAKSVVPATSLINAVSISVTLFAVFLVGREWSKKAAVYGRR